jgi:hypothetical protein
MRVRSMNGFKILIVADVAGLFFTATEHATPQHESQRP